MFPPGRLSWSIKLGFDAFSMNSHSTLDLTRAVLVRYCNYLQFPLVLPPEHTLPIGQEPSLHCSLLFSEHLCLVEERKGGREEKRKGGERKRRKINLFKSWSRSGCGQYSTMRMDLIDIRYGRGHTILFHF